MTVRGYQFVKAITRLAAVALGFFVVARGAGDPMTVLWIVAAIVVGPDFAEALVGAGAIAPTEGDSDP